MTKLFRIKGQVQNYAWGGYSFIPDLLGNTVEDKPCAEYWLGAHANAPSLVQASDDEKPLNEFLAADIDRRLGLRVSRKFGRLPFLLKVLDVKEMLSIQVHPNKKQAEKGFEKENADGIPLTVHYRNFKDDNHKPEIMVALSDFWLLHGFLPETEFRTALNAIPELKALLSIFESLGYRGLYQKVMEEPVAETNARLRPLIDRISQYYESGDLPKSSPHYWAARAARSVDAETDMDKGIYSIYFFNLIHAKPGQAIFQGAGIPHAYLEGQNVELMANSDNVLRGGLTPKYVDVSALLSHVDFVPTVPKMLIGEQQSDGAECIYRSPATDFELSKISLVAEKKYERTSLAAEILIVMQGGAIIASEGNEIKLDCGQAVLVTAGCSYQIRSEFSTIVFKATTPE